MILNVNDDGHTKKEAAAEAGVPPIEERHLVLSFFGVVVVELIGPEALKGGLVPSRACRDHVDREEEEDLVDPTWLCAGTGGPTGLQPRDYTRHSQHEQALFVQQSIERDDLGIVENMKRVQVKIGESAVPGDRQRTRLGPWRISRGRSRLETLRKEALAWSHRTNS